MIWKILSALLALVVLAVGVPAFRHLREVPPPPPPVVRSQISVPVGTTLGSGPEIFDAAISPDERDMAFVATREGMTQLWVESLASGTARPLAGTDGASMPAWKRDGGTLAFFAKGKLNSLTMSSGDVAVIADAPAPAGIAWLEDGSLLFVASADGVVRRFANGVSSNVTTLAPGDLSHAFPFVDEEGRLVYVALRENGTRVIRLLTEPGGGAKVPPYAGPIGSIDLTETAGHAELRDGLLVHVRDGVLLAQHLDPTTGRPIGRSTPLATGVGHSERGHGYFATSRRSAVWAASLPRASELAWFDLTGRRTGAVTEPGDYWQVRLSPSGRDAAVTTLDPLLRTLDVKVVPLATPGNARRVSLAIGPDTDPVWSPKGTILVYRSVQAGPGALLARPAVPSPAPEEVILRKATDVTPSDWRADMLLFHMPGARGGRTVVALDLHGNRETPVTSGGFNSWDARWSPDGRWIAYTSDESGQPEVYVQAWPAGMPRVRGSIGGGLRPQWGPAGALFFRRGNAVMRAYLSGTLKAPALSIPQVVVTAEGLRDFAIAPDGGRMLAITEVSGTGTSTAQLISNWTSEVPEAQRVRPR